MVKLLPSLEDLEVGNAEDFSLLVLCDEPIEEIRRELLEVSELADVLVHPYPVGEEVAEETVKDTTIVVETPVLEPETTPNVIANAVTEEKP